jgi:hypothetical protein
MGASDRASHDAHISELRYGAPGFCGRLEGLRGGDCFGEFEELSASVGEEEDSGYKHDEKEDAEEDDDEEESGGSALLWLRL